MCPDIAVPNPLQLFLDSLKYLPSVFFWMSPASAILSSLDSIAFLVNTLVWRLKKSEEEYLWCESYRKVRFVYYLWSLLCYEDSWVVETEIMWPIKPKIFIWSFRKNFANPCTKPSLAHSCLDLFLTFSHTETHKGSMCFVLSVTWGMASIPTGRAWLTQWVVGIWLKMWRCSQSGN